MQTMLKKSSLKIAILAASTVLLSACNGFFDKDNTPPPTPLTNFSAEVKPYKLWSTQVGSSSSEEFLKFSPTISGNVIYVASDNGEVSAINRSSGATLWRVNTRTALTTGPGVGDGIVVVGGRHGEIIALSERQGTQVWKTSIAGEILAHPSISHNVVVVKAVDGSTFGLSANDAHTLWTYQQVEPPLILRGASAPLISSNHVILGYANGNLAKLTLRDGQLIWQQTVAVPQGSFAIQRMIDIDADPIVYEHNIYAATYQGKIASLDWNTSRILWSQELSSYTGMTADNNAVFISDAKSHVWAFNAANGGLHWRQTKLEARTISGPASMGNYIVVGDAEGYLHWLSKRDGHLVGRVAAGGAIYAAPMVQNNVLYALTKNGYLIAYTLS